MVPIAPPMLADAGISPLFTQFKFSTFFTGVV
jgi:hypothetical protein